jgi:DNA-binding transcriptional LysR family regulator
MIWRDEPNNPLLNVYQYRSFNVSRVSVYASPEYLKSAPKIETFEDLEKHECLLYSHMKPFNEWPFKEKTITVKGCVKSDLLTWLIDIATQDAGLVYSSAHLVHVKIANGELVDIFTDIETNIVTHNIYYNNLDYKVRPLILFLDFLQERFHSIESNAS